MWLRERNSMPAEVVVAALALVLSPGFFSISFSQRYMNHEFWLLLLSYIHLSCPSFSKVLIRYFIYWEELMQWSCWGMFSWLAWLILLCSSCVPLDMQIHLCVCSACLLRLIESRCFFGVVLLLKMAKLKCLWIISQELLILLSLYARDYRNMTERALLMCMIYISV